MYSSFLSISLQERRGFTNFVRLAAAIAVLFSHSKPLSGFGTDSLIGDSPLGEIGVSVFFVLSGYFVFSSGLNHEFRSFVVLRVVRLFPGLLAANFCIAFVIGPIVAYFSSQVNYWRSLDGPLSYFFFNSALGFGLQPRISDLLSDVPYPHVVNGSLWTLPTELKCYIFCAFVALLVKISRRSFPLYVFFLTASVLYLLSIQGNVWVGDHVPVSTARLILVFFSGCLVTRLKFVYSGLNVFLVSMAFLGFISILLKSEIIAPFFYWIIIPAIGSMPNPIARQFMFFRSRDFSYGFYLWAFPIQQLVMHFGIANNDVSLTIVALPITLLFSVGSWYLIENPAMRYGRRLLKEL